MNNDKIRIPKCFVCLDLGFVLYHKKVGELAGEYAAHCICIPGREYAYDGQKCEKEKSPYRIPPVGEVLDVENIAARNFREWWNMNRHKPGIKEAMEKQGIPVPRGTEGSQK